MGPDIYGWQKDGADTSLYKELLTGESLDEVLHLLLEAATQVVCSELRAALSRLGTLRQPQGLTFS